MRPSCAFWLGWGCGPERSLASRSTTSTGGPGNCASPGRADESSGFPCSLMWEAIAAYLADGRSRTSRSRMVFLKVVAPFGPISADVVATVMYFACDRAGIPRFGPHRLRHMVATETPNERSCMGCIIPRKARGRRHRGSGTGLADDGMQCLARNRRSALSCEGLVAADTTMSHQLL